MTFNFDKPYLDIYERPVPHAVFPRDMTVGDLIYQSLFTFFDPREVSPARKAEYYAIAMKVKPGGLVELSVAEAALIEEHVGEVWGPLEVGIVAAALASPLAPDLEVAS